jgi:hypothetical protein
MLGMELIAENGEEPCVEIGPRLEPIDVRPRLQQCFLHQVIGAVAVSCE